MSSISTENGSLPATTKRVRFSKKGRYRRTLPLQHFTTQEIAAAWYSVEEFEAIKRRSFNEVDEMVDSEQFTNDSSTFTTRGLEGKTESGLAQKLNNRHRSIDAVLEEQEDQREKGIQDDEAISRVYRRITAKCQIYAHFMGECDELDAANCNKEVDSSSEADYSRSLQQEHGQERTEDSMERLLEQVNRISMSKMQSGLVRKSLALPLPIDGLIRVTERGSPRAA